MKKCPTCEKTFDDGLRFCQSDGTPLVDVSEGASDPFKTMVSNQNEIPAPPLDPFKTMVGTAPPKSADEDILQLPDSQDESGAGTGAPPSPFGASSPASETGASGFGDQSAPPLEIPSFNEPSLNAPSFGDLSSSAKSEQTASSDPTLVLNTGSVSESSQPKDYFGQSSTESGSANQPSPSPFDEPRSSGYQPPFKEPEQPFGQSPFGQQSNPFGAPVQQNEWTPPPAPVSNWQDQGLGANTPFQPPAAGQGQNQTLAIVALVCGILSFVLICCYGGIPFGLAALVTGFLGMQNVNKNPSAYGGKTLAIIGMILGGIAFVLNIILLIFGIAANLGNFGR